MRDAAGGAAFALARDLLFSRRMRLPVAVVVASALVALGSARVRAAEDEDASPFESKPTAVYAVVGMGIAGPPMGWLGAEVEQTVLPNLSIGGGAGWSMAGPQGSLMTRFLAGNKSSKLAIGVGISGGKYTWKEFCLDCGEGAQKSGTVAWGNLEIGGEHRTRSGFAVRYFAGYGRVIAGDLACAPDPNSSCVQYHQNDGYNNVYTGVAIGGAF